MEQIRALYDYDSLPYFDRELDHPLVRQAVTSLVDSEMKTFTPDADAYLKDYPYPHLSMRARAMIKSHEDRLEGAASSGGIDLSRYMLQAPTSSSSSSSSSKTEAYPFPSSCGEWQKAVAKGKSLVEYQENRLQHLELQVQHITPLWQQHISALESAKSTIEGKVREAEGQCNAINYGRKVEQEKCGRELSTLVRKRDAAVRGQIALKHAIAAKRPKV